jgi:hypothetical protein
MTPAAEPSRRRVGGYPFGAFGRAEVLRYHPARHWRVAKR